MERALRDLRCAHPSSPVFAVKLVAHAAYQARAKVSSPTSASIKNVVKKPVWLNFQQRMAKFTASYHLTRGYTDLHH